MSGALDLRDHDHVELVADLPIAAEVIEDPRALKLVDPGPQRGGAEVGSLGAWINPARAASFRSTGTASSRLPSTMSVCLAMSLALATIFGFEKSRKWIIRDGVTGISRSGSGAPMASGWKKSLGCLKLGSSWVSYRGGIYVKAPAPRRRPARDRLLPARATMATSFRRVHSLINSETESIRLAAAFALAVVAVLMVSTGEAAAAESPACTGRTMASSPTRTTTCCS